MKSLFFTLTLLCFMCINQRLSASIACASAIECNDFQHKKNRDRPKLKTYHSPVKVFAPIKIGRENVWTVFTLVLILTGYTGHIFLSRNDQTQFMAILLGFLLSVEISIVLLHPIIWLIRWIRLLFWQVAWRRRYRACPGQKKDWFQKKRKFWKKHPQQVGENSGFVQGEAPNFVPTQTKSIKL